ncbi:MAG TPA: MerR family transcriptional regulator [Acetobacteraceae bacterium]|jgi:DNA-binding transcriptional MerR regulator|nr:MerR family transcriptional regulator [Acetobacteraceae bacterium]
MLNERLYTVTELANELGMTARAVRFYEDKGLITPQRAGTTRVYSARDRARMILILRGKRLGFSLSTIKEYLDLYDTDITQHAQLRLLLTAIGKRRTQLVAQRQAIDEALSELDEITAQAEAALRVPAPRAKRSAAG